ncbi:hypothetical protein, partial [Serratia bockelmannii]|uniref:hypothetical protein n=1 Tax=Serratia bockelmannii TaxID=2703793 RepID=UPI00384C71D3
AFFHCCLISPTHFPTESRSGQCYVCPSLAYQFNEVQKALCAITFARMRRDAFSMKINGSPFQERPQLIMRKTFMQLISLK